MLPKINMHEPMFSRHCHDGGSERKKERQRIKSITIWFISIWLKIVAIHLIAQDAKVQHKFAIKNWHFVNLFADYEIPYVYIKVTKQLRLTECTSTYTAFMCEIANTFCDSKLQVITAAQNLSHYSIPLHILAHIGISHDEKKNFHSLLVLVEATDFGWK